MDSRIKRSALALVATALSSTAFADGVNFEDHTGPSVFGQPAQTLVYSFTGYTATFNGGTILTGETNQTTDNSSVYATIGATGGAGMTNPLTVDFSAPVHNFQIDILNAFSGNYRLSDNAGHSFDFSLATTGGSLQTVGFAATGTQVKIQYLDDQPTYHWDFAIDNITFNQPLTGTTAVPEPGTYLLMLAGLGLVGVVKRRKSTR